MPNSGISKLHVYGSKNSVGYICTEINKINEIVKMLKTCKNNQRCGSVECSGKKWSIGDCGGGNTHVNELTVYTGETTCGCYTNNNIWTARPCIGNRNWGGMNGATCTAESQTLNFDYYLGMLHTILRHLTPKMPYNISQPYHNRVNIV